MSKQTAETLMAGERIVEALELADNERKTFADYEEAMSKLDKNDAMRLQAPPRNPILAAYNVEPEAYVLRVVERVPSTALHDALLVLPFQKVVSLMIYLDIWTRKVSIFRQCTFVERFISCQQWNIVLVSRMIFFLLRTHHHQIVANRIMRTSLVTLRKHLRSTLQCQKEVIGYNLAALQHLRRKDESDRTAQFHEEIMSEDTIQAHVTEGKKRKRVNLKS